jgi:arginyl-tRNA synthetase
VYSPVYVQIQQRLRQVVVDVLARPAPPAVQLRPCQDPKFGDYQTSALIGLARELGQNPRQLAERVRSQLDVSAWCDSVELAGAGFLNFRVKRQAIESAVFEAVRNGPLFFQLNPAPRTIVVDFSSPNVAKPMHVGHVRSTLLGDCLARVFRFLGHHVITDNHVGDWGTQFGMLLLGWKTRLDRAALEQAPVPELERMYRDVNAACASDAGMLDRARQELVKLQAGNTENLQIWDQMRRLSQIEFDQIYTRLGVRFDHTLGESFYNPRLQEVVDELRALGLARLSDGAACVFSDGTQPPKEDPFLIQRDGEWRPNPFLIQKADGGFNYATTDLATLQYRMAEWRPDEIIYVTDGRQQLHFAQLFRTFRQWQPAASVRLAHVWFGSILGDDGKPIKTRSGESIKLASLLDEAEDRAYRLVTEKSPDFPEPDRRHIARVVGLGAVKYADLSPNRQSDYVFSWEKMLSLQGNTAPYLQYAYARIRSILRRRETEAAASAAPAAEPITPPALSSPHELALAKQLLNFGLVLDAVADDYRPNYLCNYLFELAGRFTQFYEHCPVLKAGDHERPGRLLLCEATGQVLRQGLELLGIGVMEKM